MDYREKSDMQLILATLIALCDEIRHAQAHPGHLSDDHDWRLWHEVERRADGGQALTSEAKEDEGN